MSTPRQPTRRQFLKMASATAGATTVLARSPEVLAQERRPVSPNDHIQIACLGTAAWARVTPRPR